MIKEKNEQQNEINPLKEIWLKYKVELDELLEELHKVSVTGKQINVDIKNEKIYFLNRRPVVKPKRVIEEGKDPNACRICGDVYKNLHQKAKECDFCLEDCCSNCCNTKLRYPNQLVIPDSKEEPERHLCCKVCLYKILLQNYLGSVENNEGVLTTIKERYEKVQTMYTNCV